MIGWLVFGAALGYGLTRVFAGYPPPPRPFKVLNRREVALLTAAANATFPAGGAVPPSGGEADITGYTDRWLAVLHGRILVLMRLLFFLIEHATLFFPAPGRRGRRRFSSLSSDQQVAVLEGWRTSSLYPRRMVFASLRAILTMGYFAHPPVLRQLRLAPLDLETPVCAADLLYPSIGRTPGTIRYGPDDVTPPSDGVPVDLDGPIHPRYAEGSS
ncbi:MAG: hypothetical protein IH884_08905 [Myxococcales bacterium]|nr:hypothetical protein [Myxococcales bacterium]